MNKLPLSGITIIDASRVLAGPFCSMLLSDFGADVIKVEDPVRGDETRKYQPMIGKESSYFLSVNRNKDVVFLNLTEEQGRKKLYTLVRKADVFLHNFLPHTEKKLGVTYDKITSMNGSIIYVSISSYGRNCKRSELPGYDILMQGESGLMSVTGKDENNLTRVGNSTVDIYTGYLCATTILSYLLGNYKRGIKRSVKLDVPLIGSAIYSMPYLFSSFAATGVDPVPFGTAHPGIVPYQLFRTSDGKIMLAVANDNHWEKLCRAIERYDLMDDRRFATNEMRVKNRRILIPLLESIIEKKTTRDWLNIFRGMFVPAAPINKISDVMKDGRIAKFVDKRFVRTKKMFFPKLPITEGGRMIYSYRKDSPEFLK